MWYQTESAGGLLLIELDGPFFPPREAGELISLIAQHEVINLGFKESLGGCTEITNQILNALKGKKVVATLEGVAGSASGLVFACCEGERRICSSGRLMLHGNHSGCFGPAAALLNLGQWLTAQDDSRAEALANRTGRPLEVVRGWFRQDTWFDAHEAVAEGLADKVVPDPPQSEPVPILPGSFRGLTNDERLFMKILMNFRRIRVADKRRFLRELGAWATEIVE